MALFSNGQLLALGGLAAVGVYLARKKALAVVESVNPVSEKSIFAKAPGLLAEYTKSTDFSDSMRGRWWELMNSPEVVPIVEDWVAAPDIIGYTGIDGDIPVVGG